MNRNAIFIGFMVLLGLFLASCAGKPAPPLPTVPPTATSTTVPTWPAPDPTQAACLGLSPQTTLVANNRVDAFVQGHEFVAVYQDALMDQVFSVEELLAICQLGATTEASLYNTGDHQIFKYAEQIDQLVRFAVFGDVADAQSEIVRFARTLP